MHTLFNFDQTFTLHALIRACTLIYFSWFLKDFCQIFRPNLEIFWQKLSSFLVTFFYLAHWWQASVIMNKTASFHAALFLVFWAKFLPARLCIFVKFPPCMLIRVTRVHCIVFDSLREGRKKSNFYSNVLNNALW